MKKNWIIVLLLACYCSCTAQSFKIQKAFAFYTVYIAGRQQTDLDGKKTDPVPVTERVIYIETNYKNKPKIDSVFYNTVLFTSTVDSIKEKKLTVGINAATGRPVVIAPQKGNRLWKISLRQTNGAAILHEQVKKIVLKCKLGNTVIRQLIANEVQLSTPDMY